METHEVTEYREDGEIQYYYNRWSEYPRKAYCPPWETQGPENRISWHKCSWERGVKRHKATVGYEFFYHYVVLVTGNGDAITVREAHLDNDWQGFVTLTLNKKGIFGDDNKDATNFALSLFADAMGSCVDESMAC